MTYDAEGVIKRKREDGRRERSEEKEEPRTRRSRGEETTITQEPEEERENTVAGEQSTKGEPVINQELEGEEDTASKPYANVYYESKFQLVLHDSCYSSLNAFSL
ncbi:hypothetical protein NDU88_001787 [Pleurodeles waltl]|uniref:Uncharacterized protein n=1 Tax=Pleurodeles waltl TaxID=8319 RepID=A0AAV7W0I2_PLEWA|nr:hypothetical protein NDU88_001787 [Pleurodeles waltl]